MTLLGLKKAFEQYLFDNWSMTEIHWAGAKFDTSAHSEWIYFEYRGQSIMDCGIDAQDTKINGEVTITVIAETRFRVMEIADALLLLFRQKVIENIYMNNVAVAEQGYIEDIDKSFIDLRLEANVL